MLACSFDDGSMSRLLAQWINNLAIYNEKIEAVSIVECGEWRVESGVSRVLMSSQNPSPSPRLRRPRDNHDNHDTNDKLTIDIQTP